MNPSHKAHICMKPLIIGNLEAKLPIVQGGMGVGISMAGLASAVANEGGIGVISAACVGMSEPDMLKNYLEANIRALRNEIRKARQMTQGILGVNIMVALTNFSDMVKTSIEEGIDIIFAGAGLPLDLPAYLLNQPAEISGAEQTDSLIAGKQEDLAAVLGRKASTKLVPIVSSARAASLIAKKWIEKFNYVPDAFVLEGPRAGGHLGFKAENIEDEGFSLEKLLGPLLEIAKALAEKHGKAIPVIAGGGIYTGEDIFKIMEMGADGVQMATRFVTTTECDGSDIFKQSYIDSKKEDIVIIESPVGMPGRAIRNKFLDDVSAGLKQPVHCPYHCIITCKEKNSPYCIARALLNAQKGIMSYGFAFAGDNAYRADKIITVKQLVADIAGEYSLAAGGTA